MTFKDEAAVGQVVQAYLLEAKQDVYCEVACGFGRVDIIAVDRPIVTAVELKAKLNFDVIGQAIRNRHYVHRSIAACPFPKNMSNKGCALRALCEATGIGLWNVKRDSVEEYCAPALNRQPMHLQRYVLQELCEQQKAQPAGVNCGYWSPFQDTKKALIRTVRDNPGITLKDALAKVKHHYSTHSSAYGSLCKWLNNGVIPEIERRDGGLYLVRRK